MSHELPLDIVEEIIQHLKYDRSYETIDAIGLVSSGCLHLARKAVFTNHEVSIYTDSPRQSIEYLQAYPSITSYIRELHVMAESPPAKALHAISGILEDTKNLNRLYLTTGDIRPSDYAIHGYQFPPFNVLALPLFTMRSLVLLQLDVDLRMGFRFAFEHVIKIHHSSCEFVGIEGFHFAPEDRLPALEDVYPVDTGQEPLDLLPLKSLAIDLRGIESYRPFVEVLYGLLPGWHRIRLDYIAIKIVASGDKWMVPTFPRLLGMILPSQRRTLKDVNYKVWVPQSLQDPFLGLCGALEKMEPENVLETLDVEVFVFTLNCRCPSLLEWKALTNVLVRQGWKSLKRVSMLVSLPDKSLAKKLGFEQLYRALPDTDFRPLLHQPFEFEFNVRFPSKTGRY
ncbi:hypothetical protein BJ165DRAFT_1589324 [Panaeolus papilionaceus]|nr:hypothetical protein BJ165DRAFT_1589324 [Panaeolus papilionaceus]